MRTCFDAHAQPLRYKDQKQKAIFVLCQHPLSEPFLSPVDWESIDGMESYPDIIKSPMDFGTPIM